MLAVGKASAQQVAPTTSDSVATVYFIKNITPGNLLRIYDALDRRVTGKVCVKLSSGEKGNPNHLSPALIAPLVQGLHADIVECNTAYPGARTNDKDHMDEAREHGFTAIAPFHMLGSVSSTALPVINGNHINFAFIGKVWLKYNLAVDRACVDAVKASSDHGKIHLESAWLHATRPMCSITPKSSAWSP